VRIVELIDFEAARENRKVPFQQIDEDALARFEHRTERDMFVSPVFLIDD
jgi:predicted secreted protein